MPAERSVSAGPIFDRIKLLVIGRTLHHYYQDKDLLLQERVSRRMQATGLDAAGYLALLEADDAGEWTRLEAEITIGETFFFRFAEQFAALSDTILPALIAARAGNRRLRIWSAGCSTGAEPYSVAILLHRLLGPALPDWSISILGTDISDTALATARAAEFGEWALRSLPDQERRRDFLPVPGSSGRRWSLRPAYRSMVRFERHNLLAMLEPDAVANEFDLVLCRNVLIYFHTDRVKALVQRFGRSLAADGWLLLGHAEAVAFETIGLKPVALDGTIAWQRADPAPAHPSPSAPPAAAPRIEPPSRPVPSPRPVRSPAPSPTVQAAADPDAADAVATVRDMADRGLPADALRTCRQALDDHPLCAPLFFYAALLERTLGRETAAEADFRRAIYLCKQFVMAHYHLGLLLIEDGRPSPGRRAIAEAARIARTLPGDAPLECGDGITAARLLALAALDWALGRDPAPGNA